MPALTSVSTYPDGGNSLFPWEKHFVSDVETTCF